MVRTGIVLVGHGAPASDCPPYLLFKLKQLAARRFAMGGEPNPEEVKLDEKVRSWPRTPNNDPYKRGLEALRERLRSALGGNVEVELAYCAYCAPNFKQAVESLLWKGIRRIFVIPAMLVPGFEDAERGLWHEMEAARTRRPDIEIVIAWPFDLDAVAALLLNQFQASQNAGQTGTIIGWRDLQTTPSDASD